MSDYPADAAVWATIPFGYGPESLDRGQVTRLRGLVGDEKLLRLGYFRLVERDQVSAECGRCGACFISDGFRDAHGRARHSRTTLSPEEEDARAERMDREIAESGPIRFDRTRASQTA